MHTRTTSNASTQRDIVSSSRNSCCSLGELASVTSELVLVIVVAATRTQPVPNLHLRCLQDSVALQGAALVATHLATEIVIGATRAQPIPRTHPALGDVTTLWDAATVASLPVCVVVVLAREALPIAWTLHVSLWRLLLPRKACHGHLHSRHHHAMHHGGFRALAPIARLLRGEVVVSTLRATPIAGAHQHTRGLRATFPASGG